MQVIVDGLISEYDIAGKGPLIVWIHGWGDNFTSNPIIQHLVKHYQVLTVHLPGFGGSQAPKNAWGLEEYAKFVNDLQIKLGLPIPLAIVGHSNGGAIAIRGLANGTLRCSRLVLLASAGIRKKGRPIVGLMAKTGKLATIWLPDSKRRKLQTKLYQKVGSDLLLKPELADSFKKIIRQDISQDAVLINQATLLIYGQEDQETPPEFGRLLAERIKHATLIVVPGTGHFAYLEQPDTIYKEVRKFLG